MKDSDWNIYIYIFGIKKSSVFRKALEVFHAVDGSEVRLTTWDVLYQTLEILG